MISSQPAGFMPDSWSVNSRPEPLVAEAEIALTDTRFRMPDQSTSGRARPMIHPTTEITTEPQKVAQKKPVEVKPRSRTLGPDNQTTN